jgi:transcriptional regulator with XRE-family HTH domain
MCYPADMAGKSPIHIAFNVRRLRMENGLSLSELARTSGVSKGTLSRLEAGSRNSTIKTLIALANSLNVTVDDILSDEFSGLQVIRPNEEDWVRGSTLGVRLLDHLSGRSVVDVYEAKFTGGMRREAEGHGAGILEHLFLIAGRLLVGPVGEAVELEAGDFIRFPADQPHIYEAIDGDAQAILLLSYLQTPSSNQEIQRELQHMLSSGDRPRPVRRSKEPHNS